jgi:hypothetical protein
MTFHDACIIGQKLPFIFALFGYTHQITYLTLLAPQIGIFFSRLSTSHSYHTPQSRVVFY